MREARRIARTTTSGFIVATVLVVALGVVAWLRLQETREVAADTRHAADVLGRAEIVLGRVRDAETGQRGYLLTGEPTYLDPYEEASTALPADLLALHELIRGDAEQQAHFAMIEPLVAAKLEELRRTIEIRRSEGLEAALAVVHTNQGKRTMDALRAAIDEMKEAEQRVLVARNTARERGSRATGRLLMTGSAVAALIVLISGWLLRAQLFRRVAAEYAHRESEERLRVTLASIGDAVIATDTSGAVTFMNGVAESLTGWTAATAARRPLDEVFTIVNEETRAPAPNPAVRALRDGTIVGLANHTVLVQRDGRETPIDDSAAPIRDGSGMVMGVVLVFRDVSDRKEAALTRERYVRAQAANEAKDEFLAVLSHELRTPLNAMRGWVSLLRKQGDRPEIFARAVDVLERNVTAQTTLINDLLDVSRIVSGKLQLDFQLVDLPKLVREAVDTLQLAAGAKNVALTFTAPPRDVTVRADDERLRQIVANLVNNALKFTPAGGRVDVGLAARDGTAVVTVADTGTGIPADFLPYVFDRFRQADGTASRTHGGLGLGLAIVKHLVERHGGTVAARSGGTGLGATFTVALPLMEGVAPDRGKRDGSDSPHRLGGFVVLLLEDDTDTREGLSLALAHGGARVVEADDAASALAAVERDRPDVIAAEVTASDAAARDFIRAVRERDGGRTPMIAMTALGTRESRAAVLAAGFDEQLAKPIDPDVLIAVIHLLAAARGPARPAPHTEPVV